MQARLITIIFSGSLLLFQSGCALFSKKLVESQVRQTYITALSETDLSKSCEMFLSLSGKGTSLFQELLDIRIFERCTRDGRSKNPTIPNNTLSQYFVGDLAKAQKSYFENQLKNKSITEVELRSIHRELSKVLIQLASEEKNFKTKEALLKDAQKEAAQSFDLDQMNVAKNQLMKTSPRLFPARTPDELLAKGNDYRRWREFDSSIREYQRVINNKSATMIQKVTALKNIRQSHKTAQNKPNYLLASKKLYDFTDKNKLDASVQADALHFYARALWTEDQGHLAQGLLNKQIADKSLQGNYTDSYWILAKMAEEKADYNQAFSNFDLAIAEIQSSPKSSPGMLDKIRWNKAWLLWKTKQTEKALELMIELSASAGETSDRVKALYWASRSAKTLGKIEQQQELLQKLQIEDPIGYYGMLSYYELNSPIPPVKSNESFDSLRNLPLATQYLLELDEYPAAVAALDELASKLRKTNETNPENWKPVLLGYARAGSYLPLFASLSLLPAKAKDQFLLQHPELIFPTPWKTVINQAQSLSTVPKEMIYSIIRQESAFNPYARSQVDAFGIMQLLPSVAEKLAKQYDVPYRSAEDLYNPEICIPLGAYELKNSFDRTKGSWIRTVASYNASEKVVGTWLKMRHREDGISFIEDIPYDETRNYLKLVMRNQIFYYRLGNDKALPFPENLIKL